MKTPKQRVLVALIKMAKGTFGHMRADVPAVLQPASNQRRVSSF